MEVLYSLTSLTNDFSQKVWQMISHNEDISNEEFICVSLELYTYPYT